MPKPKDERINVREAAKECGRNPETVRRWVWSGKLPAQKLGNQLFIRRSDLAGYCRETAVVEYRAGQSAADLVDAMHEERMEQRDESRRVPSNVISERQAKFDFLKKAQAARQEIYRRSGTVFDAGAIIRELRDGRENELE